MTREIRIVLTFDPSRAETIQHQGVEELNAVLQSGGRVLSVQGPNMLTKQLGLDSDNVELAFIGMSLVATITE